MAGCLLDGLDRGMCKANVSITTQAVGGTATFESLKEGGKAQKVDQKLCAKSVKVAVKKFAVRREKARSCQ